MKGKTQKRIRQWQESLDKDYEIFHYLDREDLHTPLHSHDFYEVYFLISGELSYQIFDTFFTTKPGDVVLLNINQPHRPLFVNPLLPYDRIVLRVSHDALTGLSTDTSDLAKCFTYKKYALYRFPADMKSNIRIILSKLLSVQEQSGFGSDVIYKAYLLELLVLVNRYCYENSTVMFSDSARKSQLIEQANHYIDENLDRNITVAELAEHICLSKFYFMRFFKDMTGSSIHQYITHKRLVNVCSMLMKGVPVTSAYTHWGFRDYSGFYRAFKKHFGCSPKQYLEFATFPMLKND